MTWKSGNILPYRLYFKGENWLLVENVPTKTFCEQAADVRVSAQVCWLDESKNGRYKCLRSAAFTALSYS
jgi:hypothetical protein